MKIMRKFTLIITFLTVCITAAFGQSNTDSLTLKTTFGSYKVYQGYNPLSMKQLALLMKNNDQASKQIRSAKTVQVTASVIGFAGGFMVGYPLGTALVGGEPNWVLAGVGAGLIVVSITLNHSAKNKTKRQHL